MKKALRKGGYFDLNVYTADLGDWPARLGDVPREEGDGPTSQDGVVILDESLPGGKCRLRHEREVQRG